MKYKKWIDKVRRSVAQRVEAAEREVAKQYAGAIRELTLIIDEYYRKYEKDGRLTLDEMNRYDRLTNMYREIDDILRLRYNRIYRFIYDALGFSYEQNWNLAAWQLETSARADLGYSTASLEQMEAAINGAYAFVPLKDTVEQQRANVMYQFKREIRTGLHKGESYKTIADRIAPTLKKGQDNAITTARTEVHRVQEQAGLDVATKADEIGIVMVKEWNSSQDERVRKTSKANHRKLDGVKIPVDKDFVGVSGKGKAPGQMGTAAEDINCRCFLTYEVVNLQPDKYNKLEEQAFDAWEKLKRAE